MSNSSNRLRNGYLEVPFLNYKFKEMGINQRCTQFFYKDTFIRTPESESEKKEYFKNTTEAQVEIQWETTYRTYCWPRFLPRI